MKAQKIIKKLNKIISVTRAPAKQEIGLNKNCIFSHIYQKI